jgi:amidase
VIQRIHEYAKTITPEGFLSAISALNSARRKLAQVFTRCDVWLTPTTARVAEPFGRYNLGRRDVTIDNLVPELLAVPCQYTIPHNIMGTPAISLPLAMHSTGLPIGIPLAGPPAEEHVLLGLAGALEAARPWAGRIPPLHVSKLAGTDQAGASR